LNYTNSWGHNNIPKSAKKWGRTAHLHEVRSAVFSSTGGQRSGARIDHDRARPEYDSEDVFTTGLLFKAPVDDPWVDTDSVGSE
jgi:hypothetical protein